MQQPTFHHYLMGSSTMGMGLGVISILARGANGSLVVSSPEMIVKYGIFGGLGFALMVSLALFLFAPISKWIRNRAPYAHTVGDVLREKLPPTGYWLMIGLLLLTSLDALVVQELAAGYFLHSLFQIPLAVGLLCFAFFCLLYAGIGGLAMVSRMAVLQVSLIFCTAIFFPVYFFVRVGVGKVYEGIHLFHPYLLVENNRDMWLFMAAGFFMMVGQLFMDRAIWQRIFIIEPPKLVRSFFLSGFIGSSSLLAFTSLVMVAIYTGRIQDTFSLFYELVKKMSSPVLLTLFVASLISLFSSTYGVELHAVTSLFVRNVFQITAPSAEDRALVRCGYLFAIALVTLVSLTLLSVTPTFTSLLFFFGMIYAVSSVPLLLIVFGKGRVGNFVPASILPSLVVGYLEGWRWGLVYGIFVGFAVSACLNLGYLLWVYGGEKEGGMSHKL